MMLVVKTHIQKIINNNIIHEAGNEYKIVDCPPLTEDQQQALATQVTPMFEQERIDQQSNWTIKETVQGWCWENDNYLTAKEKSQKEPVGEIAQWAPSFSYVQALSIDQNSRPWVCDIQADSAYQARIKWYQYMHANPPTHTDGRIWGDGLGVVACEPWIWDLVQHYDAKSMLEVGAGRGAQCLPRDWGRHSTGPNTLAEHFGLLQYSQYDPAVPGIDRWPDQQYDCTIAIWVVGQIREEDFEWWLQEVAQRSKKFCFLCGIHRIPNGYPGARTEQFYLDIFQRYWKGPDLYYLHDDVIYPWKKSWYLDNLTISNNC